MARRLNVALPAIAMIGLGCTADPGRADGAERLLPLAGVECRVHQGMEQSFLGHVRAFAKAESFELSEGASNPRRGGVVMEMVKGDYLVVATNPFEPHKFAIHFYFDGRPSNAALARPETDRMAGLFLGSVSGSARCAVITVPEDPE